MPERRGLGRRKAEVLQAGKAAVGSYEQENNGSLRAILILTW